MKITKTGSFLFLALAFLHGAACAPATSSGTELPGPPPSLRETPDEAGRAWVEETLASLSLREAVGQLIVPWMPGAYTSTSGPEFLEYARYVEEMGIGGVAISIGLPHSYGAKLNALQARARVPLLVASDFESGGPGMRISHSYALPTLLPQGGGTSFPPTMAFGAVGEDSFARAYGRITGEEARAVGVHLNFAPVLDVNSNPENPIINTRAFGGDPREVARLGAAFVRGSEEGGVLTTAKHFPGHGDTRTDSHVELPVVPADRERLDSLELVPFRRAVEEGVDAVMTAHVAVPGVLGPDALPATLSSFFLTRLLREQMGFDGLVLTDAIRMQAIARHYGVGESAVLALEAGADVILAPADVALTLEAVVEAVGEGRIARERIDASVRRILEMKARVGLHRNRYVDLDRIGDVVGSGDHLAFADTVAARSITLPRDEEKLVPAGPGTYGRVLHVVYARETDLVAGRAADALLGEYFPAVESRRLGPATPRSVYEDLAWDVGRAELVVVSAFVPPRSGAGSVAVPEPFARFVEETARNRPTVVVSLGNPYLLSAFPGVGTYLVGWGPREVSQEAAVRALVGEAGISGVLPIALPPHHERGDGLRRAPVATVPKLGIGPDRDLEVGIMRRGRRGEEVPPEAGAVLTSSPAEALEGCRRSELEEVAEACRSAGGVVVSPREVGPGTVGMDAEALARVDSLVLEALADSASPGAAVAVGRHGRLVRLRGYGRLDWGGAAPPATPASLWDMASVTKVATTATAAMILAEATKLDLDAPVVRYLPWWSRGDPRKEDVTVRHLLLHRGGLPPFVRFFREVEGKEAFKDAIADLPLVYAPGDSTVYSDIGLMTVAFVVEEIAGTDLDAFMRARVWDPLGMRDSRFRPDPELLDRIAPTEVDRVFRFTHVHGEVHDENAWAMGRVAGHAGLFSSARDMAVFAQTFLEGGGIGPCVVALPPGKGREGGPLRDDPSPAAGPGSRGPGLHAAAPPENVVPCSGPRPGPVRIAAPTSVDLFTRRHDSTSSRALGWDTPSPGSSAGSYLTEEAFGHTGFTGTSLWVDPELDLFVVLLTSRTNPTRENRGHVPLRRAVHDAVARAITDRPVRRRTW